MSSLAEEPPASGARLLVSRVEATWEEISRISRQLVESSRALRGPQDRPSGLLAAREQYEREAVPLLLEPIRQFQLLRPIRRSLEAFEEFDREAPGAAIRSRARIDTRFEPLLAGAGVDLCEAWRIRQTGGGEGEWQQWERRLAGREERARGLLAGYRRWAAGDAGKTGHSRTAIDRRLRRVELWWRRQAAVTALHQTEAGFHDLRLAWLDAGIQLVESLRGERAEILGHARRMTEWVGSGADPDRESPVDAMALAALEERLRGWSGFLEDEAGRRLVASTELISPRSGSRFRRLAARESFLSTFRSLVEPPMRQAVGDYWEGTARIVRESSRAREIIDYWRGETEGVSGQEQLYEQARDNATKVLSEQFATSTSSQELEAELARVFWLWSEEGSTVLEGAETGWVELLRKPRGRRLSRTLVREGRKHAVTLLRRAARWGANRWEHALETIGGKLPSRPSISPVVRRTNLRDTLALPASKSDLPRIYGSLFRVAPIEDRRFLIGRDSELIGLEQALQDWDEGRFAACIVVGARGSGKTSLLNCAQEGAFQGRELLRTEFRERATTAAAIDDFLAGLIGIEPGEGEADGLLQAFASERRILVLEEAERIYLRKVGGFEGAYRLMHWVQHTAVTTFWILVMNDRAFQALDAGADFSRVFSHRINAMSISRNDLENALLERHRLSGLRLDFAAPPAGDPRISRVRSLLGLEQTPQQLYFDSLYQQSGGVFRSAFELWLSSIERVEGETLKIRQPLEPAFAPLRNELGQADLFTLLMIQEHGSLEYAELAELLVEPLGASRARIDRLEALGLVENDPDHPGYRVRPEGHRFVGATLRRVNLTEELT